MTVEPFWTEINETALRQGDYLPHCLVPEFGPDLAATGTHEVTANEYDVMVVTQSCDLEQRKVRLVAVYPHLSNRRVRDCQPRLCQKGPLE